jgi:hypothetical protein
LQAAKVLVRFRPGFFPELESDVFCLDDDFSSQDAPFPSQTKEISCWQRHDPGLDKDIPSQQSDIPNKKNGFACLEKDDSSLKSGFPSWSCDIPNKRRDVAGLKSDEAGRKQDISNQPRDAAALKNDVSGLEHDVTGIIRRKICEPEAFAFPTRLAGRFLGKTQCRQSNSGVADGTNKTMLGDDIAGQSHP